MQRELGFRHQKLVEDAQRNRRVAVKFLKASLGRCVPLGPCGPADPECAPCFGVEMPMTLRPPPVTQTSRAGGAPVCGLPTPAALASHVGLASLANAPLTSPPSCRVRKREREEELKTREHLRQRVDAVLALKNSITASRVGVAHLSPGAGLWGKGIQQEESSLTLSSGPCDLWWEETPGPGQHQAVRRMELGSGQEGAWGRVGNSPPRLRGQGTRRACACSRGPGLPSGWGTGATLLCWLRER